MFKCFVQRLKILGGGGVGYFGLILAGYVRLAYQNPYLITSLFCGHVIDPILVIFGTK